MKSARLILASLVLGTISLFVALQAHGDSKAPDAAKVKDEIRLREQILQRMFQDFERALLQLKQRLERSPKEEDKARAAQLAKVLEECADLGIGVQFEQMLDFLTKNKFASTTDVKIGQEKALKLADDLRRILQSFREDSKHAKLRDERLRLEQLIKELERIIHNQKIAQGITEAGKTDSKELRKIQEKVTNDTAKLAKAMGDKSGAQGEPSKGDNKDKGKGDGKPGESKDAGKSASADKQGQAKEAGPNSDAKKGDAKGDPSAQGKSGDKDGQAQAKGGDKGADGKDSGAKGSKGSDGAQASAKDNKGGSKEGDKGVKEGSAKDSGAKDGQKGGDKSAAKGGDPKSGDKSGDKSGGQAQAKAGDKGADSKAGGAKGSKDAQAKAGDSKSGDSKSGGDSKQGEAKPGQSSQGQGQAKQGGQQGQQQPPQASDKGAPPKGPQDPKDNVASGKKQVEDANYKQKQAEDNIAKNQNKPAADDQGKAIDDLQKAKKKLEDLLRQIREEELERLLAALQARCEKMLAMQMQVLAGTERVFKDINNNPDKKAERKNQQDSIKLSDQEKEIVNEATKAIEMLEAEGSAVAFPEVFQQVREDMKNVQRRLEITEVGDITQAIEKDIIDTLKEMIEALKKAKQELDNKKSPPGQPKDGAQPPNADQKLLDQIAELKMIRSMQLRVNARTKAYGSKYVPKEGEQTSDPIIRAELNELSQRQERIFEITHKIAKGDNK